MADCTNQHQSSIGDWTGLQHHVRFTIMFNIVSTWENRAIESLIELWCWFMQSTIKVVHALVTYVPAEILDYVVSRTNWANVHHLTRTAGTVHCWHGGTSTLVHRTCGRGSAAWGRTSHLTTTTGNVGLCVDVGIRPGLDVQQKTVQRNKNKRTKSVQRNKNKQKQFNKNKINENDIFLNKGGIMARIFDQTRIVAGSNSHSFTIQ